jgi:hypothetical protein
MSYSRIFRFTGVLALVVNFWTVACHADDGQGHDLRYRYVALDQIALPSGFTAFFPSAIRDNGWVYGTICDSTCSITQLAYVKDGMLTALGAISPGSFTGPVNKDGTVGGAVLVDPVNGIFRAALFRGAKVELIPPQPEEIFAFVVALNDHDTAVVSSFDASGYQNYVLYSEGKATPIGFSPSLTNPSPCFTFSGISRCINNLEIIEGIEGLALFNGARGFRLDTRDGEATILNPYSGDPTETLAWGQAINQRGDVLGYSFTLGVTPYHERIGVWERNGLFDTYFVESDVNSSKLLFNDDNLIVITLQNSGGSPPHNSYIVPRPGVRLNLADLVVNLPAGQELSSIADLNSHGDMIGSTSTGANFLLQRLEDDDRQAYAAPAVSSARHAIPQGAAIMRSRLQLGQLK